MNADHLLALYDRVADAPDAIPRLRRLVLDLAVRGKLVEHHPADKPASELLKQIAAGKERLAKTGKRNKEEPTSLEDLPFAIPQHWQPTKLKRVLEELQTGPFGSSLHQSDYCIGGTPVINPASIQNEKLVPIAKMAVDANTLERLASFKLRRGDIVMARRGDMGRCALVTSREAGWLCGTGSLILRPSKLVFARFLVLLIGSPFGRQYLGGSAVGSTMQNLNQAILLNLPFGLPPLAEQQRIVAKVGELMAICGRLEVARTARDATRDRLTAAGLARLTASNIDTAGFRTHVRFALAAFPVLTTRPNQIKILRQTILNLAVRGRLVEQDASDEPASELLERLKKAQMKAYRCEGLRSRPTVAKLSRSEMWFEFPERWVLSSFDDVFVIVSGVTKGQKVAANEAVDLPYLRVANVQRGHLDLSVIKKITARKADAERYALRCGDILMTEGGDWDKLGRAAVWRQEIPGCIHQNHVFRVRPPSKDIVPEWVATYVNSLLGRAFFEDASKQTTNLASINMTQLRSCPIPLPSLAEQHRIVAKVDELMKLSDRLEASLREADTTRRHLLDAMLHEVLHHTATTAVIEVLEAAG